MHQAPELFAGWADRIALADSLRHAGKPYRAAVEEADRHIGQPRRSRAPLAAIGSVSADALGLGWLAAAIADGIHAPA